MKSKICIVCGKEFVPDHHNQKICKREHFHPCPVCGKPVKTTNFYHLNCCSTECTIKKRKMTNLEVYGCEGSAGNAQVQAKMKATCKKNHGVEWPAQSKKIHQKQLDAYLSHYGKVENPEGCRELQSRREQTSLDHFGYRSNFQLPEFKDQAAKTLQERYGVTNATNCMHIPEIKQKVQETNMKRYGHVNYAQSEEGSERIKHTNNEKYGCDYTFQAEEVRDKIRHTNMERYGVPWYCMTDHCKEASGKIVSKMNKEFSDKLTYEGVENSTEFRIRTYSFDICIESKKLLIELDPTFTHTSLVNMFDKSSKGLDENYHIRKSEIAEEAGYRCIHVFDWDDWNKVIMLLSSKDKIFARKCVVSEIDTKTAKVFLDRYHIQSSCSGLLFNLGLYYQGELIELMSFGKPRYNRKYEWELLRLCSNSKHMVIGGSEKIFKHFLQYKNPSSVISYCDNSKFTGDVYKKLQFTMLSDGHTPSKHWYKNGKHITDNLLRQRGYDQLFNAHYGKGTSNEQLMIDHGWLPIYDCGQSTYVWRR